MYNKRVNELKEVGCKELRYKVIHRFRDRFTVEELCKLLEVSRSGYYKWLKRKDEPDKDKVIAGLIVECHEKAHRTYGYRRVKIAKELVDEYIYFYNNERIQLKTGLTPMEARYAYAA